MKQSDFIKGAAAGMLIGIAAGFAVIPRKKRSSVAGKMLRAAGIILENVSDALGI